MFYFRYQDPACVQGNHLFGPHLLYGLILLVPRIAWRWRPSRSCSAKQRRRRWLRKCLECQQRRGAPGADLGDGSRESRPGFLLETGPWRLHRAASQQAVLLRHLHPPTFDSFLVEQRCYLYGYKGHGFPCHLTFKHNS